MTKIKDFSLENISFYKRKKKKIGQGDIYYKGTYAGVWEMGNFGAEDKVNMRKSLLPELRETMYYFQVNYPGFWYYDHGDNQFLDEPFMVFRKLFLLFLIKEQLKTKKNIKKNATGYFSYAHNGINLEGIVYDGEIGSAKATTKIEVANLGEDFVEENFFYTENFSL
jgi:hypothetical protein